MRYCILLITILVFSCQQNEVKTLEKESSSTKLKSDSFYTLEIEENTISIEPPTNSEYSLTDSSYILNQYKTVDFNNDNKKDVLLNMGACGTGGCVYAVFLNQHKNHYKLAYEDYLKSPELVEEENGYLSIKSYEEIEAYNPLKLNVSVYKFNDHSCMYLLDTSYVLINE